MEGDHLVVFQAGLLWRVTILLFSSWVIVEGDHLVVFRLGYFERKYTFYSQNQLMSEIIRHYSGQAIRQV